MRWSCLYGPNWSRPRPKQLQTDLLRNKESDEWPSLGENSGTIGYNCFLATPIFQLLCVHETFLHVNQNSIKQTFNEIWGGTMGKSQLHGYWKHWKLRMARKSGRCENIKRILLWAIYILHAVGDVNPQRRSGCHSHRHCSPHPPFSREEFQEAKFLHGSTWCRSHKESVGM